MYIPYNILLRSKTGIDKHKKRLTSFSLRMSFGKCQVKDCNVDREFGTYYGIKMYAKFCYRHKCLEEDCLRGSYKFWNVCEEHLCMNRVKALEEELKEKKLIKACKEEELRLKDIMKEETGTDSIFNGLDVEEIPNHRSRFSRSRSSRSSRSSLFPRSSLSSRRARLHKSSK